MTSQEALNKDTPCNRTIQSRQQEIRYVLQPRRSILLPILFSHYPPLRLYPLHRFPLSTQVTCMAASLMSLKGCSNDR
jgi:hypothetical protein